MTVATPRRLRNETTLAAELHGLVSAYLGLAPIRLKAWDGSVAGPEGAPLIVLRSKEAARRLLWSPSELGLARAYVRNEIDVAGDLGEALRRVSSLLEPRTAADAPRARRLPLLVRAARLGLIGPPPPASPSEARVRGRLHSAARDAAVIDHHYNLSNAFYATFLGASMAYSCGYWRAGLDDDDLDAAQAAKLELIASKLAVGPGTSVLDLGCGWGAFTLEAARRGAHVDAVTLAREQAEHVAARAAAAGLSELVTVHHLDYREIPERTYDAIAAIEIGEHVGRDGYPAFVRGLARRLRPGGRVLIQQMSRPADSPGGGPFIETYIAPDMFMRPVGETVALVEAGGLEVRDVEVLREHYAATCWAWYRRLGAAREEAAALVGEEVVRVFTLYLAGIALGFERGRTGVDQILAVRRLASGASGMPATRADLAPRRP